MCWFLSNFLIIHYLCEGWDALSVTFVSSFRRPQPGTIRGCCPYRSSLSRCRFGRSGSRGFAGGFLRLRLSNREPVPRVCAYRNALCQDWKFHAGYDLLYYFLDFERVSKINFSNPIKFNKGSVNNSGLHLISNSNIW